MENASKALIMAAGVLIGILILSIAVYLAVTFGSTTAETYEQIKQQQIEQINNKYLVYQGRNDLTIYDIVTVANMANENNKYFELSKATDSANRESNSYISVFKENTDISYGKEQGASDNYNSYITIDLNGMNTVTEDDLSKKKVLPKYTCTNVKVSTITGRVYEIDFKKNN